MTKTTDIVTALVAAQVPGSTDNIRAAVIFETVAEFCREVLQTPPPTDYKSSMEGWMADGDWIEHHTTIISGAIARLCLMSNKPWSNPGVAQAHLTIYQYGSAKGRAIATSSETAQNALDRIMDILRIYVPNARNPTLLEAVWLVVDALTRDVLQIDPPAQSASASTWLTEEQYGEHQALICDGTLAYLFGMTGQPWYDIETAKLHAGLWQAGAPRAREHAAAKQDATSGYKRIMVNIRVLVPLMRDPAIQQELFNTLEAFQRTVRQKPSPLYNAAPQLWVTDKEYTEFYRAIMAGTLARIYSQSNKPWTDPAAAGIQQAVYLEEVGIVRGDAGDDNVVDPTGRLLGNIRSDITGAKDPVIFQALFNIINEACRRYYVWVETVPIQLKQGQNLFTVNIPGADIVRVSSFTHPSITEGITYDNGKVLVQQDITKEFALSPLLAVMALAPSVKVDPNKPGEWIPEDLWGPLHAALYHGVLATLMISPMKSYSNPKLALYHGQEYRRLLMQARYDVLSNGVAPSDQNWSFPRFA